MSSDWDSADQRWADVAIIAAAVKHHLKNCAYLLTGGSDGCALCRDRSTAERVEAGSLDRALAKTLGPEPTPSEGGLRAEHLGLLTRNDIVLAAYAWEDAQHADGAEDDHALAVADGALIEAVVAALNRYGDLDALAHPAPEPQHDAAVAAREVERLTHERDDARGGYRVAAEAADRFRDVLAEALGHPNENPGDDVLVAELRAHFGRSGPEPTRWRDFCTGAKAVVDQINAERSEQVER